MEEDRLDANLGPSSERSQEEPIPAKPSKRRFVGRKVVAERTGQQDDGSTESFEGKGAVAGGASPALRNLLLIWTSPAA